MTKRQRGQSALTHSTLAAKIGVSRQRITAMLRNIDKGDNRTRITAALKECHLTENGVEAFLEQYKTNEQ